MAKSDVMATSHKERVPPKVISHIEIHPNMKSGHDVHVVHTHPYDHLNKITQHEGPHDGVDVPSGHILHSVAKHMGIQTTGTGAGSEEDVDAKEAGEEGQQR